MAEQEKSVPSWMRTIPAGRLDPRVLTQERYWVNAEGVVLPLTSMSQAHLAGVLVFLHNHHAVHLHMNAMVDALIDLMEANVTGGTTAEQITHQLTGGASIASVDAHAWIEATPLVRAVRRELNTRR